MRAQVKRETVQQEVLKHKTVMIAAGEASSDQHAAALASALTKLNPEIQLFGMGGAKLREVGVETVVDSETVGSVMGLTEVFASLAKIYQSYRTLIREAEKRRPDLLILVDFPDFNFRLAKALHRRGVKTMYFITPQVWAWRKGRVKFMKKYIDEAATIFPFEESFFQKHGLPATYVGHPFLDRPPLDLKRDEFLTSLGLDAHLPVLGLCPGSRRAEVQRLFPVMIESFQKLKQVRPDLQAIVPVAGNLDFAWVRSFLHGEDRSIVFVQNETERCLASSDLSVLASGTITVEAALLQAPMIVVYKFSPLTYVAARLLVRGVKHFAMVNVIAGEKLVPELLQNEVTVERLVAEIESFLGDRQKLEGARSKLGLIRSRLLSKSWSVKDLTVRSENNTAAFRAAELALKLLGDKPTRLFSK